MDVTFVLFAIIFTLLAIVVATSLLSGSCPGDFSRTDPGQRADTGAAVANDTAAKQNGHVPSPQKKKKNAEYDWCEMSGSSHEHWDLVKTVLSEEEQVTTSTCDPSKPAPRATPSCLEVDPAPSKASPGAGRGSFIGLSGSELLKCAFSHPQNEGAAESPDLNDKVESNSNSCFTYVPGKSRSQHMQRMMSKDELEEEQRVQREQLAAIFQLLKENKETFGDVSQGDIEEQLKLYSI